MTIYECDFCKEQKPCRKIRMDDMEYDICVSCDKRMGLKLKDRGTKKLQLQPIVHYYWGYNQWPYYTWPTIQWPVQPTMWPPIVTVTGVLTTTTCEGNGGYAFNSGNISSSSSNNTLLLDGKTAQ